MNRITALIIDDEERARENIFGILDYHFKQISIVGKAASGEEALKLVSQHRPDTLFLDVQMPEMDGFELLDKARELLPLIEVIFITAYDHYAIDALRSRALDYIVKPIKIIELKKAIGALEERLVISSEDRLSKKAATVEVERMAIPTQSGVEMLDLSSIVRIEADGGYSKVFSQDSKKPLTVTKTVKQFEETLSDDFFRIHKSHLIRLSLVSRFLSAEDAVMLKDGIKLPVAARRLVDFKAALSSNSIMLD